jgi:hypothetical protein
MKQSTLAMASMTVFLLLGGLLYPAPAHSPGEVPSAAICSASPVSYMEIIRHDQGFNLESCETNCRSYFGIPPYVREQQAGGGSSGSNPRYLIIANCIEHCQNRFWKEFDNRMKGLERAPLP